MGNATKQDRRVRDKPFLRAITFSYLLATLLLAAFAIGSHVVLREHTEFEATSAALINTSGNQRMLSQRVLLFGNRLVETSHHRFPPEMEEMIRHDLLAAVDRLEQSHQNLVHGNSAMKLPGQFSDAVRAIYFDGPEPLDTQLGRFVGEARALASSPQSELSHDNTHLLYLNHAGKGPLLAKLDMLVRQYQSESEANITRLQSLQRNLMGSTLMILLLLVLFIFRPMARRIRCKIEALQDAETALRNTVTEQQKAEAGLRESERRFRIMAEASGVSIFLFRDKFIYANPAAAAAIDYTLEEIRQLGLADILHPDSLAEVQRGWETRKQGDTTPRQYEVRYVTRSGDVRWGLLHAGTAMYEGIPTAIGTVQDITQRKQAENELRLFLEIFNHSVDAIAIIDRQGHFVRQNQAHRSLLGYSDEALDGKTPAIHLGDETFSRIHHNLVENGEFRGEVHSVSATGQQLILDLSAFPVLDESGAPRCYVGIKRDVTARCQAGEALRQSEEKFRLLFELSSDGICVLDMEGNFIDFNHVFHDQLGYSKAELLAREHIAALNTPEAAEVFIRRLSELKKLGHARFESFYQKSDGTIMPVEVNARIINFDGKKAILSSVRDMTARKYLETELAKHRTSLEKLVEARTYELSRANRKLAQEITDRKQAEKTTREIAKFPVMDPAPVLRTDRHGTIGMANRAARRLLQGKRVLGASIFSLCPELDESDLDHLFDTEQKTFQFETRQHKRRFLFSLLADTKKGFVYAYGADITQIRQLEHQIQQSQKMEAVGQLAGGIAHDFNSLLGVILGHGVMLRDDLPSSDPSRDHLEEMLIAGNRAKHLVKDLMDFSRPADDNQEPLQLGSIIEESTRMLRAALPTTIQIHTDIKAGTARVLANATQIGQILMNLGINAGDAIGEQKGEIRIALSSVRVDDRQATLHAVTAGAYLRLTISDNGRGMNEETMARVFEPFFTTKAIGSGSGLGLAVVHGIVKNHGGFIAVDSHPGKGSHFHVFLPAMNEG